MAYFLGRCQEAQTSLANKPSVTKGPEEESTAGKFDSAVQTASLQMQVLRLPAWLLALACQLHLQIPSWRVSHPIAATGPHLLFSHHTIQRWKGTGFWQLLQTRKDTFSEGSGTESFCPMDSNWTSFYSQTCYYDLSQSAFTPEFKDGVQVRGTHTSWFRITPNPTPSKSVYCHPREKGQMLESKIINSHY